ncbi:MAG TPA: universal stress protein, UspA [Gammaproteobacteria bacterium]|nr:universal stress protein, UspA [Gammaproteobacteria bacterium]
MKRFNNILCVVEPDKASKTALLQALYLAEHHQADLTIVSTIETPGAWHFLFRTKEEEEGALEAVIANKRLAIEQWIRSLDVDRSIKIDILVGNPFLQIIRRVLQAQHDLVIKCSDDPDWMARLFGSDDMHLLRKCPCPVLMLKAGHDKGFRQVLVAVDANDEIDDADERQIQHQLNLKLLHHAALFSISEMSQLHVGSVWDFYGEEFLRYGAFSHMSEEKVDEYISAIRGRCADRLRHLVDELNETVGQQIAAYLQPSIHLVKGQPARAIPLMAQDYAIDLIVMGTVARTGIPGLIIGNTAEAILEQVTCSVLAIKPDGFVTPVDWR